MVFLYTLNFFTLKEVCPGGKFDKSQIFSKFPIISKEYFDFVQFRHKLLTHN